MIEVRRYVMRDGRDPVEEWLRGLRDLQAKIAVLRRLNRIETGNLGDSKAIREGVHELRIDAGPGYRVCFARSGSAIVLLLAGGSKRTQASDIERACARWRDWQDREDEH